MSKDDPEDLTSVQADDELLDAIGQGHIPRSSDPVVSFLTGWRMAVHAEPVRVASAEQLAELVRRLARRRRWELVKRWLLRR
jgi:hypothetical protein